jgi:hypothetical protein
MNLYSLTVFPPFPIIRTGRQQKTGSASVGILSFLGAALAEVALLIFIK